MMRKGKNSDQELQNSICSIISKYGVEDIYSASIEILIAVEDSKNIRKYTPTPWKVTAGTIIDGATRGSLATVPERFGEGITEDDSDGFYETRANAALIVRAVNAHEDLVNALTELLNAEKETDEYPVSSHEELIRLNQRWKKALEAAHAALAKAKGE